MTSRRAAKRKPAPRYWVYADYGERFVARHATIPAAARQAWRIAVRSRHSAIVHDMKTGYWFRTDKPAHHSARQAADAAVEYFRTHAHT